MKPRPRPQPITRTAAGHAIALFATDATQAAQWTPRTTLDGRPDGPRRPPKNQPERTDVLTPTLAWLRDLKRQTPGLAYRRITTTGRPLPTGGWADNPMKGMEDIQVLVPPRGRVWAIETKSATGAHRDKQQERQREVEAAGGVYTLARSLAEAQAAWEQLR